MNIKFIDLFAGIGGIRKGLENAIIESGNNPVCVMTSEIKPHAVSVLKQNHPDESILGDIYDIKSEDIPDFDILCAGFPCQAFSYAGKRLGFQDERGILFFQVKRILEHKRPKGFILENVEGLVTHDSNRTFATMLDELNKLNYTVSYKVLNSKDFSVPQDRKRVYIVGTYNGEKVNLKFENKPKPKLKDILETGLPTEKSKLIKLLLSKYKAEDLYGKSIKDKRGGKDNIHSWDLEIKGKVTKEEKQLLDKILTERRKKKWAERYGIDWMDGMPLTKEFIEEFYQSKNLQKMLDDLVSKGYLTLEHPKRKVLTPTVHREQDLALPLGYNIVAGKLSFDINKILDPESISPTLVAMDMNKIYVVDCGGLRKLTLREGLRLFGYPDDYKFDVTQKQGFDLLGNTVVVPVIKEVATRLLTALNI